MARYSQAQTYEDFIKKINKENDLDNLRQLRYQVIGEIMQVSESKLTPSFIIMAQYFTMKKCPREYV